MKEEYILCAANYYNDGSKDIHGPKNIEEGFIICGRRHHNCIGTFAKMVGFPYTKESLVILNTEVQGFLTNLDRFVDRKEALEIAIKANQLCPGNQCNYKELFSEDLY